MSEYYGNGMTTVLTRGLVRKYPNVNYNRTMKGDILVNVSQHFEDIWYPSLLTMFIDRMGPRYIDKLVNCDIPVGITYSEINESSIVKDKIILMSSKPIPYTVKMDEVISVDNWTKAEIHSVSSHKEVYNEYVWKQKIFLAMTMMNAKYKFFDTILMDRYVRERLKYISMIPFNDIFLIDMMMVDAIIQTKMS